MNVTKPLHRMVQPFRVLIVSTSLAVTVGCANIRLLDPANLPLVYRIDVQQGNVVTQDMLAQLKPGMDKAKVRFIMGTPLVIDLFHQDRWDYIYTFQKGGGSQIQRRLSLYFEDDQLARIEGNVIPARGEIAFAQHQEITVDIPNEAKPSLISRLKESIGLRDGDKTIHDTTTGEERTETRVGKQVQETGSKSRLPEVAAKDKEKKSFFSRIMENLGMSNNKDEKNKASTPHSNSAQAL